jgi:O-methyltransferase involved in polyketide biosynthesis
MSHTPKHSPELGGVAETMLWTLFRRAFEARNPRTVLPDPKAVELVDTIDYPFEERLGPAGPALSQGQALRVRTFDRAVRDFLAEHPAGTVVALGEGLETQFWRVDNGTVHWLGVDLPEVAAMRRRLLPDSPDGRRRTLGGDVLELDWAQQVATDEVLITAQGLLMYLRPPQVRELIAACAERFPGATMVFDAVPRWFGARTVRGRMSAHGYTTPPMPWAMDAGELPKLTGAHPSVSAIEELPLPRGRGTYYQRVAPIQHRLPGLRNLRPTMTVRLRFAA